MVAVDLAGRGEADVDEAAVGEERAEVVAVEAGVEDAFGLGRVEGAVLGVEVGEGEATLGAEVLVEALEEGAGVLDVVESHGADDEVDLGVEGRVEDVLAVDVDFALELGLVGELGEHGGGDVDGVDARDVGRELGGDEARARAEVEDLEGRLEGEGGEERAGDAFGDLGGDGALVPAVGFVVEVVVHGGGGEDNAHGGGCSWR